MVKLSGKGGGTSAKTKKKTGRRGGKPWILGKRIIERGFSEKLNDGTSQLAEGGKSLKF